MTIANVPGLFSIIQGAKAQVRPVPQPMPAMPNIPGRLDGGPVSIPGYGGDDANGDGVVTADEFASGGSMTGGGAGAPPPMDDPTPQYTAYYYDIAKTYGLIDLETGEPDLGRAKAIFDANPSLWLPKGSGPGGDDAATYAGIAQRAAEAAMADRRERDFEENRKREQQWSAAVEREKANQEFFNNREALKQARAQLHSDRATNALNAWQKGLGTANIPGMEKLDFFNDPEGSAKIMGGAPLVRANISQAYGQMPQWEEGTAPNIPGLEYS